MYKLQPPPTPCHSVTCYWRKTRLYQFKGMPDGAGPTGDIVFDNAGNLYGTTESGGQGGLYGNGVVFQLAPSQSGWSESVVYAFIGGADGGIPETGVQLDESGNLYGTASRGGALSRGVVFELSPGSGSWTETVLHSFAGGSDGKSPSGMTIGSRHVLYGETGTGGQTTMEPSISCNPPAGASSTASSTTTRQTAEPL